MIARSIPAPIKLYPTSLSSPKTIPPIMRANERAASLDKGFSFLKRKKKKIRNAIIARMTMAEKK